MFPIMFPKNIFSKSVSNTFWGIFLFSVKIESGNNKTKHSFGKKNEMKRELILIST